MPGMSPHIKIKKGRPLDNWPGGNTPPVINITAFDANPDFSGNPFTSEYVAVATDAEQGDISANIVWNMRTANEIPATAGVAQAAVAGAPAGSVVPLTTASATYDVDVTFEDGGLQQLAVVVANTDDYDAIAAILDGAVINGTVTFAAGAFVFTDDTASGTSTALVAAGTAGSGGGDLFAAITAEAAGNPAVTFPAPVAGTALVPEVISQVGTGGTPSITFVVTGTYPIEAEITDGFGATVTDSESLTVTNV